MSSTLSASMLVFVARAARPETSVDAERFHQRVDPLRPRARAGLPSASDAGVLG
jgi:hypothetical protein